MYHRNHMVIMARTARPYRPCVSSYAVLTGPSAGRRKCPWSLPGGSSAPLVRLRTAGAVAEPPPDVIDRWMSSTVTKPTMVAPSTTASRPHDHALVIAREHHRASGLVRRGPPPHVEGVGAGGGTPRLGSDARLPEHLATREAQTRSFVIPFTSAGSGAGWCFGYA